MTLGKIIVIISGLLFPLFFIKAIKEDEAVYTIAASIIFMIIVYLLFVYAGT